MADKSGVYLPGTKAAEEYEIALNRMLESLDERKKPMFDPTFMAIAAGASKPAYSWGETLGNVASSINTEQEKQRKLLQEEAAMRLEIASKGMGMEQQRQRYEAFKRMMGGDGAAPAQPSGGLPAPRRSESLTVEPVTGEAKTYPVPVEGQESVAGGLPTPPGFEGVQGIQVGRPNKSFVDRNTYLSAAMLDPSIGPAQAMEKAQELEKKRYETKEGGVFDISTGMFFPFPKGELVERQIYGEGAGKTYKVDQRTAALLDLYASTNDPKYFEVADRVLRGPTPAGGVSGGVSAGSRGRIPSVSESEVEKEGKKVTAQKTAEASVARGEQLANRAEMGAQNRESANDLISYAKSNPRIFGLLQQPGIAGAIKRAADEGITTGVFTVKLPTATLETYKLSKDDLDALQMASQASARLQAQFRKMERTPGEGSISDMESRMFAALAPLMNDSDVVIRLKSEMLIARANFDEKLYERWVDYSESTGNSYQKFLASKEYKDALSEYRNTLKTLRDSNASLFSKGKRPSAGGVENLQSTNPPGVDRSNKWLR